MIFSKCVCSQKSAYLIESSPSDESTVPVLVSSQLIDTQENGHSLQVMRWGLIPSFVPGDESFKFHTFNARIESLLEKQTYKLSMKACKRCVVVAQGFYEWKTIRAKKQPFYFRPSDPEKLLMMAGLFAYNHEKQQSDDNDESKAQEKIKRDPDSKTITNKIKKEESSQ
ncbi:unnamed protein product [Trichobilharzia regenti]|nr:unnamed protein product [Trichobilharzia regenti]